MQAGRVRYPQFSRHVYIHQDIVGRTGSRLSSATSAFSLSLDSPRPRRICTLQSQGKPCRQSIVESMRKLIVLAIDRRKRYKFA
ncbi:hypothetical protein TNCV_4479911 [Trichonephila clavipes]|nr:hypothetical protein TNCV_4479911 [Trichonephila clavipes]